MLHCTTAGFRTAGPRVNRAYLRGQDTAAGLLRCGTLGMPAGFGGGPGPPHTRCVGWNGRDSTRAATAPTARMVAAATAKVAAWPMLRRPKPTATTPSA